MSAFGSENPFHFLPPEAFLWFEMHKVDFEFQILK